MNRTTPVDRRNFLSAGVSALLAASVPHIAVAAGAKAGPWCRPLSKAALENIFDFELPLLDRTDATFELSTLAGRAVWLNFFTSWCPPCNEEVGDILRVSGKYAEELAIVGISVKEKAPPVRAFRTLHHVTYPIALDEDGTVFKTFGFNSYPTHMFLDARGIISCISHGDLNPDQMENEIAVAVARAPIARESPRPQATP